MSSIVNERYSRFLTEMNKLVPNGQSDGILNKFLFHFFQTLHKFATENEQNTGLFISQFNIDRVSEQASGDSIIKSILNLMIPSNQSAVVPQGYLLNQDLDRIYQIIKDYGTPIEALFSQYSWHYSEYFDREESNLITPEILGFAHEYRDHKLKKKKQGVFYTPRYIAEYMCKSSLKYWILENVFNLPDYKTIYENREAVYDRIITDYKPSNYSETEIMLVQEIQTRVLSLRILDNACGTGIFLISMLKSLFELNKAIYFILHKKVMDLSAESECLTNILIENLFGVDIDEDAIEIAKMRLILAMESLKKPDLIINKEIQKGKSKFPLNLRVGNSVLGYNFKDPHISGKSNEVKDHFNESLFEKIASESKPKISYEQFLNMKPFHWSIEFPDIIKENGFDIIIGNPPYIKEYDNRTSFLALKANPYYQGKADIWYIFACESLDLLKPRGILSYIAQNNWITSFGAKKMRDKFRESGQLIEFIDFNENRIFSNAEIQTMIFLAINQPPETNYVRYLKFMDSGIPQSEIIKTLNDTRHKSKKTLEIYLGDEKNDFFRFEEHFERELLNHMQNHPLVDFLKPEELGNGIDPHQYKLSAANLRVLSKNSKTEGVSKDIYKLNEGIFVLTSEEKEKIPWTSSELRDIIKPFYTAKEIGPYFIRSTNLYWVLYTKSNIRTMIDSYPNVKKHLDRFSPIITSDFKPYGLHRARNQELFEDIENNGHPRILSLRKTPTPVFTLVDVPCYVGQSYYVIRSNNRDPYFLLGLANSSLIAFWLSKRGKMQGQNLQIDFEPLLATPFLKLPEENDPIKILTQIIVKFQCINPLNKLINVLVIELYFHDLMFHENIYSENSRLISRRVKELIQEFQFDSDLNEKSLKTKIDKLSNDPVIIELTKKTRDWIRKRLKRNL